MADNNYEHPGPDEPAGGSAPEGDFPADFFDDGGEPSPVLMTPGESAPDLPAPPAPPPYTPAPPRPPVNVHELSPPAMGPPSAYKAPAVEPIEDEGIKMSAFPAVLGVLMAAVLVAAWFVSKLPKEAAAAPAPAAAPSTVAEATPPPPPPPATTAITDAIDARVKGLADDLDELIVLVKANEAKLNGLPKPEPAPDLKPIEAKLEELAKSVGAVAPLGSQVGKLGDRVGSVDGELKTIKGELAALKNDVQKAAAAKPASEPKPAADETATAMEGGVELIKARKYPQADEVFKKLAEGNPKDARVYYYAALAHGLTTSDLQGETAKALATKGADLEKAGSPKSPVIDASFADLPPDLKPWLSFFRRVAK